MLGFLVWMCNAHLGLAVHQQGPQTYIYVYVGVGGCVHVEVVHSPDIGPHVMGRTRVLRHPLCCHPLLSCFPSAPLQGSGRSIASSDILIVALGKIL